MRRAAKIDDNQNEIVDGLRKLGCSVAITSGVGSGFPDLIVGRLGVNILIEVKDGGKSPSRQALTLDQVKWHDEWRGQKSVCNSLDAAIDVIFGSGQCGAAKAAK